MLIEFKIWIESQLKLFCQSSVALERKKSILICPIPWPWHSAECEAGLPRAVAGWWGPAQWPSCQGLQTKNCTHTLQLSICSNLVENFTVFSNQSFRVTFIKIPWLRPAAIKLLIILCKELSVDWVRSGVMFYDSYLNIVNHHHVSKLSGTVSVWVEQRNVWPRPRPASISRMLNVNNGNII